MYGIVLVNVRRTVNVKKLIALCLVMAFTLVGCSSGVSKSKYDNGDDLSSDASKVQDAIAKESETPQFVLDIFKAYKDYENKYECAFQTSELVYTPGTKYGDNAYDTYTFDVQENPAESVYTSTVRFFETVADGFTAWFPYQMNSETVNDFIVATVMIFNPEFDHDAAIDKAGKMIISYLEGKNGDNVVSDEYTIFLSSLLDMKGTLVNVAPTVEVESEPNQSVAEDITGIKTINPIAISANVLVKEIEVQQSAAQDKYKGKNIQVSGTVVGISSYSDLTGYYFVNTLKSGKTRVVCWFDGKVSLANIGDSIEVVGYCRSVEESTEITECKLVE